MLHGVGFAIGQCDFKNCITSKSSSVSGKLGSFVVFLQDYTCNFNIKYMDITIHVMVV